MTTQIYSRGEMPTHQRVIAVLWLVTICFDAIAPLKLQNYTEVKSSVEPPPSRATPRDESATSSAVPMAAPDATPGPLRTPFNKKDDPSLPLEAWPLPQVACDETRKIMDECFRDLPPHLMEFLQSSKIVLSAKEITDKCTVFNRGMRCIDDYSDRCLTEQNRILMRNNVEAAKNFFHKFCDDRDFQNEYLKNKECFKHIQDDWEKCTKTFQDILSEELNAKHKNTTHSFLEFCCARHGYEECIYKAARYKCYKNSAIYARDTAKMLSDEKHFTNCRQYEHLVCNDAASSLRGEQLALFTSVAAVYLLRRLFGG